MSLGIRTFFARNLVGLQVGLVVAAMLFAALYPPAHGKMLLIPAWPGAERRMIALAINDRALLVGAGPFPHSFVVSGDRFRLIGPMLRRGIIVLAAPPAACGENGRPA